MWVTGGVITAEKKTNKENLKCGPPLSKREKGISVG